MLIGLSFFKPRISLKIFNFEIKSNPSISKLSCFQDFSRFKHLSFINEIFTHHNTQKDICFLDN